MTRFGVAVLVVLHVAAAVAGPVAVLATGVAAGLLRRPPAAGDGSARTVGDGGEMRAHPAARYFRPGTNWASRSLVMIPVFGAGAEALHRFDDIGHIWPWLAFGMWSAAAALAFAVHWPAEASIQAQLAADEPDSRALDVACRRAVWSSAVMTLLFVACVAVMVTRP